MTELLLILAGLILGVGAMVGLRLLFGRRATIQTTNTHTVFEQVRRVGKLVGMEVCAKEIATSTKGFSWLPPILLSQARVAMIFQFEKQFSVDLVSLGPEDVQSIGPGRYRLTLPAIEGSLRLVDVIPYDIQAGRALGLVDIIQVDAATQGELMKKAQAQASELYTTNDSKHERDARASVERQLRSFLSLLEIQVEIVWRQTVNVATPAAAEPSVASRRSRRPVRLFHRLAANHALR